MKKPTDTERLTWLLKHISHYGTDGLLALPWSVREYNGEDSDVRFDRRAIDRAMRSSLAQIKPEKKSNTPTLGAMKSNSPGQGL